MTASQDHTATARRLLEQYRAGALGRRDTLARLRELAVPEANAGAARTLPMPPTAADTADLSGDMSAVRAEVAVAYLRSLLEGLPPPGAGPLPEGAEDIPYSRLGLTSMDLVRFNDRIEDGLGVSVTPTVFFDHPTLRLTAEHLARSLPGAAFLPADDRPVPGPSAFTAPAALLGGVDDDIAIIGMAGRFPGAGAVEELWSALLSGRDLLCEVPPERWDHSVVLDTTGREPGRTSCGRGGFIDGVDLFDAPFFGVSPREAEVMDPQLRLLLEVMYATAEDAAVVPTLRGSDTGTFVGLCFRDYDEAMAAAGHGVGPHDATGNAATMAANRPAHFLDLKGPSLTIDTACSSSLVAVHQAVTALRRGECRMAFAAGANLILSPRHYLHFSAMGALSPSGRCHSFAATADGYVPAEAVAAVLLKPLSAALADGDPVHAIIKGSAVAHTGRTASVTAPAPRAQTELLLRAWADAGIDPATVGLWEAHGTGTVLGDPIETEAIRNAFAARSGTTRPRCALGSAKAHLGHTEAAAGITGLIKTVLSLRHRTIAAMPGFDTPNPYCRLDEGPLYVNRETIPWEAPPGGGPRRAGVSSFGFGGTGAHVVVEEPVPALTAPAAESEVRGSRGRPLDFPLSAGDADGLRAAAAALHRALRDDPAPPLPSVAATLATGREAMAARLVVRAGDREELLGALDAFRSGRPHPALVTAETAVDEDEERAAVGGWARGEDVDWRSRFAGDLPRRVSLPGHPFARERYWFDDDVRTASATDAPTAPPAAGTLYFTPVLTPSAAPAPQSPPGLLLVVGARGERARAARAAALRLGLPVPVLACHGTVYRRPAADTFELDLADPDHHRRLHAELAADGRRPAAVIWPAEDDAPGAEGTDTAATQRALLDTLAGLTALLTAWTGSSDGLDGGPLRLVTGGRGPYPRHEALAGFARSAARWDDRIGWNNVSDEPSSGEEAFLARLFVEAGAVVPGRVEEVVHRGDGHRRLLRFERATPPGTSDGSSAFLPGGRYLVTGGLGGIGRLLGRHLARTYRARLVLTGRSPLDDAGRERLAELEGLGGEAVYVRADAASPEQMNRAVAFARSRFGGVDGVLHLAGTLREAAVPERTPATARAVLDPKVAGTLVLDLATQEEDLDLFLVLSSMATVVGTPLLPDYAAANRFADGFVEHRERLRARGLRRGLSLAVDYPYWDGGGLRMPAVTAALVERTTGMRPFSADEALGALEDAVRLARASGTGRVVTAVGDHARIEATVRAEAEDMTEGEAASRSQTKADVLAVLTEELCGRVRAVLKLRRAPDPFEDLTDCGFESITVHEFVRGINEWLGVELHAAAFFEHRTIDQLARHLADAFPDRTERAAADSGTAAAPAAVPESAVAVVGMAGVFPGAADLDAYWLNLREERDLVGRYPDDRLPWPEADPESLPYGGFLERVDLFDPEFFRCSQREAELMDPQQRLFLMTAHRALDDAAIPFTALAGSDTGVFVGVSNVDHADVLKAAGRDEEAHAITGLAHGMVANRLSYLLDLHGPSEAVDTACSSSLVALHRAVLALRSGECRTAVVGGVNILAGPRPFQACARAGMLSPTGRCHTFDRRADGYVRGEGIAAVVLKPLRQALADGDRVQAVIRGSGVGHGGHAHGLTVPDPLSQAALLTSVYREAGVDPATISYIEAHGTGTALGDPIEINGLKRAFASTGPGARTDVCGVGTVKTSIGHLESASGIAGLVKTVLALRHRTLPASLHCEELNPQIDLADSPLRIVRRTEAWEGPEPLRAGVSSFGFGGVNAHVLLEEWREEPRPQPPADSGPHLILLSALDDDRLAAYAGVLADHLTAVEPRPLLADVAHTLAVGRAALPHRLAVPAYGYEDAVRALREYARTRTARPPAGEDRLGEAARAWSAGQDIPAELLPAGRRITLPGCPFTLRRCWPGGTPNAAASKPVPDDSPERDASATPPAPGTPLASDQPPDGARTRAALARLDRLAWLLLDRALRERGHHSPADAVTRTPDEAVGQRRLAAVDDAWRRLDSSAREAGTDPRAQADLTASVAAEFPEVAPYARLVARCVPAALDVLAGRVDPLEVLFPEDDPHLLEGVYGGNPIADHYNGLLATAVLERVTAGGRRPLRILEIGAGTGATTTVLLDRLAQHATSVHYTCTDVASSLVHRLRDRFGDGPVPLTAAVFDVEREPDPALLVPGGYDVVVATNVLHATRRLDDTLRRVRDMLADNGLLVVNELTRGQDFLTLTFGLTRGWWNSDDTTQRLPGSPLLSTELWRAALDRAGFRAVRVVGPPESTEPDPGQAVLVGCAVPRAAAREEATDIGAGLLRMLRRTFSDYLRVPSEELDPAATFDRYHLDSLSAVELVRRLETPFGRLPKTLLYECTTLDALAARLLAELPRECERLVSAGADGAGHGPVPASDSPAEADVVPASTPAPRGRDLALLPPQPVAIVGLAGVFPRSPDADALWRHLMAGADLITEVPPDRFDPGTERGEAGTEPQWWGGFADEVAAFDADFFGITPLEAELMDPQQRLFLQVACAAVEHAGHSLSSLRGTRTGVFAGVSAFDYHEVLTRAGRHHEAYAPSGVSHAVLANRVSYLLDLHGPSEPVDTACSSSLVALHRAVRCLQAGDCTAAIVGGVNLLLTAELFEAFGEAGFLSPSGRCRTFDRTADGYVRAEGAAAVLLKPLSAALADGDTIHALVRGSGVNHGGRVQSLTVPSPTAQAELVASVHREAGVAPATVTYVETHGTGTALGDPIEVEALKRAFATAGDGAVHQRGERENRQPVRPWCGLGSVKSNTGHLEAAAGMAGLVKVVLAMRHGVLPPSIHLRERNPLLELADSPFHLVDRAQPWRRLTSPTGRPLPRRAGVSSFGFGGANGHVLLEEYLDAEQRSPGSSDVERRGEHPYVLVLSARTEDRLRAYAEALCAHLEAMERGEQPSQDLADIAFTLRTGRDALPVRLAVLAQDRAAALRRLRAYALGEPGIDGLWRGQADKARSTPPAPASPQDGPERRAQLWVTGAASEQEWPCEGHGRRRRVPLPTYPFARDRHWATPAAPDGDEDELRHLLARLKDGQLSVEDADRLLTVDDGGHG